MHNKKYFNVYLYVAYTLAQEPAEIACYYEQGRLFHSTYQHGKQLKSNTIQYDRI